MEKTSAEQAKSTSPPFGGGVRVWGGLPVIGGVCLGDGTAYPKPPPPIDLWADRWGRAD
jgi:hypothetical protein